MVLFCLDPNPNLNLAEHFIDAKGLHIDPLFKYRQPDNEADRMNCLYNALVKDLSLEAMHITPIVPPGNTEHFCRFSGGGDILISKKTEIMVISNCVILILHSSEMMIHCILPNHLLKRTLSVSQVLRWRGKKWKQRAMKV